MRRFFEGTHLLVAEVVSDHAHEVHVREVGRGQGEVGGGAAEDLFGAAGGGFEGVVRDTSDYEN
jgi:hypothetical protein